MQNQKLDKKWLKLDLNENPYGKFGYTRIDEYDNAKKKIARYANTKPQNIVLTNGAAHALDLIFSFLLSDKAKILIPTPNFFFYNKFRKVKRLEFITTPYYNGQPIKDIHKKIINGIKGIYISNPNNPLGYSFSTEELKMLISRARDTHTLIVVDEAYFEFCDITVKNLVNKFNNLIVVRTISKAFGLAGARIGYIITNRKTAELLEELRGKLFEVGRTGIQEINNLSAVDFTNINRQISQINKTKKEFIDFLSRNNITSYPSEANFVTIRVENSKSIVEKLKKEGILVSDLNSYPDGGKILKNCIRITIPHKLDMLRLKKALIAALSPQRQ